MTGHATHQRRFAVSASTTATEPCRARLLASSIVLVEDLHSPGVPTKTPPEDYSAELIAYEQLLLEGYLVSRAGGGTFVSPDLVVDTSANLTLVGEKTAEPVRLSRSGRRLASAAAAGRRRMPLRSGASVDFVYGLCTSDSVTQVA